MASSGPRTRRKAAKPNPKRPPNLRIERAFFVAGHLTVAGSDEVGRGSLGGPVSAGIVVVDESTTRIPAGLRDSKLLRASVRERLVPRIERWAVACAVGHASAAEIDAVGLLRTLRLAGERALDALGLEPDMVVLDGNYDWFRRPEPVADSPLFIAPREVTLQIKADLTCASVAAASVLAKVERDQIMREMAATYPEYGWDLNKGYATPDHLAALRELGPCVEHRRSWRLPGDDPQLELAFQSVDDPPDADRQDGQDSDS